MNPPIEGMTVRPHGEEHMFSAWYDLVCDAVESEENRAAFKEETGVDIQNIIHAKGLNAMIDEATGSLKDATIKWAEWVTVNLWGVE